MELDQLKTAWHELDRKLETQIQHLHEMQQAQQSHTTMLRFARLPLLDMLVSLGAAILLGSFTFDNRLQPQFLFSGIVLTVANLALLWASVLQLVVVACVDFTKPVAEIQSKLSLVRVIRLGVHRAIILTATLLWTPLAIVIAEGFFGWDVVRSFGLPWILWNLAVGIALLPILVLIGRRLKGTRIGDTLDDAFAGKTLKGAIESLKASRHFSSRSE